MIKIDIWSNGFIVEGHAQSAQYGQDIVCAGVSAIVLGALNWFDANECKLKMSDGYVSLFCDMAKKHNHIYLELLTKQLTSLEHNNNYLHIRIHKGNKNEI